MRDIREGAKIVWRRDPLFCVATVMAPVAAVVALIETATRPRR